MVVQVIRWRFNVVASEGGNASEGGQCVEVVGSETNGAPT
jgi:hypothetical protein